MKRLITLLLIVSIAAFGSAQTTDGGATQMMKTLAAKYKGFSTMKINYTYKAEKDKKTLSATTGVALIKGEKYYITFDDQVFYCDSVTMWNYQKSTNEVSIYDYDGSSEDALNPAKLLATWQKDFSAKFIREEVEKAKTVSIIDLTPKKGQSYYKIRLVIDKNKNEIVRISIYEKDNTIYTYYFDTFAPNAAISDSTFKFNASKYPGVEVNDMR